MKNIKLLIIKWFGVFFCFLQIQYRFVILSEAKNLLTQQIAKVFVFVIFSLTTIYKIVIWLFFESKSFFATLRMTSSW